MTLGFGSGVVNRAPDQARSRSNSSQRIGRHRVLHSTPCRREARDGSVVPASPVNTSSESRSSRHSASEDWTPGRTSVRTPTSAPRVPTNGGAFDTGRPDFGSMVVVTPRASFEWKPKPKLEKSSVFAQGPKIAETLGEMRPASSRPELAGLSLITSKK